MQKAYASALVVLWLATSASARCLDPSPRLLCAEYFQSDAVVTAKLLKTRRVTLPDDDYFLYTMRTERVFRGKVPAVFKVVDDAGTGRALIPEEEGPGYLLFLRYQKPYKAWSVDNCGNSHPLSESADTLKRIDQLQAGGNGGTIQGVVFLDPGSTVLVRGKQGTFKTTTDQQGHFEVHVPAGQYSVSVIHQGKRFEPDDLSYEDPKKLRVHNGGCAQVQFNLIE
ncbi:MAG TPA: hypothetical protein VG649_17660 [Candidatus Angelobacter sp.]|nr:hypothetical protein [Candidatus Angelobacter sp.]